MNLKERGVTVGDLVLLLIILISTIIIAKGVKNDKKSTFNYDMPKLIFIEADKILKS